MLFFFHSTNRDIHDIVMIIDFKLTETQLGAAYAITMVLASWQVPYLSWN